MSDRGEHPPAKQAISQRDLQGRWMHSHEEDTPRTAVYRPADYAFPPSRGRVGFELREDQTATSLSPGRGDRPDQAPGCWELRLDQGPTIRICLDSGETAEMEIVSVDPQKLVVRRAEGNRQKDEG